MRSTKVQHAEITLSVLGSIYNATKEAIALATDLGGDTTVSFDFNGRTIKVRPDTNIDLVMRDFWRPLSITGDTIGPYPDPASLEIDERLAMERGSNFATII